MTFGGTIENRRRSESDGEDFRGAFMYKRDKKGAFLLVRTFGGKVGSCWSSSI